LDSKLIVLAESAISPQPGEAALNDPSQPGNLERSVLSFDDPEFVTVMSPQLPGELSALIPASAMTIRMSGSAKA
jgi:hypothetical protein